MTTIVLTDEDQVHVDNLTISGFGISENIIRLSLESEGSAKRPKVYLTPGEAQSVIDALSAAIGVATA